MTSCRVTDLAKSSGWTFQHRKGLCRRTCGYRDGRGLRLRSPDGHDFGGAGRYSTVGRWRRHRVEGGAQCRARAYNTAAIDAGEQRELSVKVVAEDGSVVAGLAGWTWGTCAGTSLVWVREDARRQGWGGQLLAAAERVARQRGCQQIIVTSFTFQAPRFYELHGYVETGRVEGLPVAGEADVHLRKQLQPDDGASAVPDADVAVGDLQRGSSIVSEPSTVPITWKP